MAQLYGKSDDVIYICHFLTFLDIGSENKLHHWYAETKLYQMHMFVIAIYLFQKFSFLTWPRLDISQISLKMISKGQIGLFLKSTCKTTHKSCIIYRFGKVGLWWPSVAWPWPWPVLSMLLGFIQCLSQALDSTVPQFGTCAAHFAVSRGQNVKTLSFDLWPDLDLTFDLKLKMLSRM